MSMAYYPTFGMVIAAKSIALSQLVKELCGVVRWEDYERFVAQGSDVEVLELLEEMSSAHPEFPAPTSVFIFQEEDVGDPDLETGKMYVSFSIGDIFDLKPNPAREFLESHAICLCLKAWAKFG